MLVLQQKKVRVLGERDPTSKNEATIHRTKTYWIRKIELLCDNFPCLNFKSLQKNELDGPQHFDGETNPHLLSLIISRTSCNFHLKKKPSEPYKSTKKSITKFASVQHSFSVLRRS